MHIQIIAYTRRYNNPLRDILPATLGRANALPALDADGRMPLALPEGEHPLFKPFTRRGRSGFTVTFARLRPRQCVLPTRRTPRATLIGHGGARPWMVASHANALKCCHEFADPSPQLVRRPARCWTNGAYTMLHGQ